MNAEKLQARADPGADFRRVFTDPAAEDQSVQSAERGGMGADEFSGLITEQGHRVGRAPVVVFPLPRGPAKR